jgi:hypothetical protein
LTKRWIKFEETAESAERRWSKPHVPTLTQTSIEDLMILIENGVILLDPYIAGLQDIAGILFKLFYFLFLFLIIFKKNKMLQQMSLYHILIILRMQNI